MPFTLKTGLTGLLATYLLFFPKNPALAVTKNKKLIYAEIPIDQAPQKSDWQYFMHADPDFRKKLWSYYEKQGKSLNDWSWEWRIGWVSTCIQSRESWCWNLYKAALFDQALVVRSEATVRIGERFKGSKNPAIIKLLSAAYKNPQNLRGGKPLFIQERILFAIQQIGGKQGIAVGKRLAKAHQSTAEYWKKLTL
jgi:hypothetical protein